MRISIEIFMLHISSKVDSNCHKIYFVLFSFLKHRFHLRFLTQNLISHFKYKIRQNNFCTFVFSTIDFSNHDTYSRECQRRLRDCHSQHQAHWN